MWFWTLVFNSKDEKPRSSGFGFLLFLGVHLVGFRGFTVWGLGRSGLHVCFACCSVVGGHFRFQGRVNPEFGLSFASATS